MSLWETWIRGNWSALRSKQHIPVPQWMPHPSGSGFRRLTIATPEGQIADWALPLNDRSRIHVHQFADGRLVAHRDRFDPDAGPIELAAHLVTEHAIGRLALAVVGVLGVIRLMESA